MSATVSYYFDKTLISTPYLICIDDNDKPYSIDNHNWIAKGEIYVCNGLKPTKEDTDKCVLLVGKQPNYPFEGYSMRRFVPFLFSPN